MCLRSVGVQMTFDSAVTLAPISMAASLKPDFELKTGQVILVRLDDRDFAMTIGKPLGPTPLQCSLAKYFNRDGSVRDLAVEWECGTSTVTRWLMGVSAPGPHVAQAIIESIDRFIIWKDAEWKAQYEETYGQNR